jgi:signal transduction histidine kinase
MHPALDTHHGTARSLWLRWALALGVAMLVLLGWSAWSGSTSPAPNGARDDGPWLFGIVALLLVGTCGAVAGHFHARWRALQQAAAGTTPTGAAPVAPSAADGAALALLMENQPGPAWLFLRATEHDGLRLHARNAAADAWLRSTAPDAPVPHDWNGWLQVLPGPLAQAVRHLAPGQAVQQGAWTLRLSQQLLPGGGSALALVMQPVTGEGADGGTERESFSYTVSHDLRAPLRVVDGFARILKEDYGRVLDRIGNDHLDRVLGAAARMNSMIDALLALSALSTQSLARQPVNLSQLAGFVVDDLRRESPERVVEVQIEPGLATHGDPTLLRMVLENLLGNAWKYTGRCERAQIAFETTSYDGRQVFVVRDNGAGFDMRFADRLFGVFQRLHSANDFQGTGVGLASVRRIVRRHGGEVWAESEVGQGARFYFTLG